MAVITPDSDVILLKVPLEIDDTNQLTFASATAQYNYFYGLTGKKTYDKFTYQRKDGVIRIPEKMDDIITYNYVMYRNEGYSNKWFYAYITGMEYVNDSVTAVSIKTDCFQTWMFELTMKPCFVEREHVNDDTVGANTVPEGLELGEYTVNTSTTFDPSKLTTYTSGGQTYTITTIFPIFFQVTGLVAGLSTASSAFDHRINGIFSGLYVFAVDSPEAAHSIISKYDADQNGNEIVAIFLAPKEFLQGCEVYGEYGYNVYIPHVESANSTLKDAATVTRPSTVNGYTPKNNKMFTWPFSFVTVSNNAGINTEFKYEDFGSATPQFSILGTLGQGCTTKLYPINYKNSGTGVERFDYSVTGAKYPMCAWVSDYYTNWVTQNSLNIGLGLAGEMISAPVSTVAGINYAKDKTLGTLGTLGAGISMLTSIASVMGQTHAAKAHPDQARGNVNCSDMLIGARKYFTVNTMSVRAEIAKCCDEFFSMFGYKVSRVKTPNVTGRTNWNYVKTIGCYIQADIPQEDLQTIKNMFDKGVTFWHNPSTFGDYSQSNAIVTP